MTRPILGQLQSGRQQRSKADGKASLQDEHSCVTAVGGGLKSDRNHCACTKTGAGNGLTRRTMFLQDGGTLALRFVPTLHVYTALCSSLQLRRTALAL